MPKLAQLKKKKALKNTIAFGVLSTALYLAVFLNEDLVTKFFTKGGIYCVLPVFTAIIFSFVHGAFTGNFLSAIGIEPSRKTTKVEMPTAKPAKRVRPRPRLHLRT